MGLLLYCTLACGSHTGNYFDSLMNHYDNYFDSLMNHYDNYFDSLMNHYEPTDNYLALAFLLGYLFPSAPGCH